MTQPAKAAEHALSAARSELEWARTERGPRSTRATRAERLAGHLLGASRALSLPTELSQRTMLARLVEDPRGQAFTTALTDRAFRARAPRLLIEQLRGLVERWGLPVYLPSFERAQLRCAAWLGPAVPHLVGRAVQTRVRQEARQVLLRSEEPLLSAFLAERKAQGIRVNVNQLGEALLGEREAEARVAKYVELARRGGIDALSVKVSSIGSQLNLVAFEHTAATLAQRMVRIYAATLERASEPCLVMLDMEAYQDVALTFAVLDRALFDPALRDVRAGVVLQAYLPDANELLRIAARLSEQRIAEGRRALHVRLVKGANLAQERVDSQRSGHALPMFDNKCDVDANYKRVLEAAVAFAQKGVLSIGVGSHNLFDLAYALILREEEGAHEHVGIEMLEGMANDSVRALRALGIEVLVYAPVCSDEAMSSGIAYLVRRLDENTSSDNFLRASFGMQPGDAAFERERRRFHEAITRVDAIEETPMRERKCPAPHTERPRVTHRGEPDSDFASAETRAWLHAALAPSTLEAQLVVRSQVAGSFCESKTLRDGVDPSRPGVVPYRIALADAADVQRALACAATDPAGYSDAAPGMRDELLRNVATLLRARRGALIRTLLAEAAKRVVEADAEVSEAIDFAEYYRLTYAQWCTRTGHALRPRGPVVVTPPWNFPLAIAAGGVLSALVAGNRVILKPALETPQMGAQLAQLVWDAGVPKEALQLVICEDRVGSALIEDPRVDTVILTGATDTARLFQRLRPGLRLLAETGGKNAYVVSAMSDRELAIRDVVHSAFGHAGQKCSAASLLILAAEVYDDPKFRDTLADAASSLCVASAWDLSSFVTPLIRPPEGALSRALGELAPGESWLLEPRIDPENPRLVSPGVKLGVQAGSFTHTTELFGPVLSVLRAESLDHAITLANQTGYALTAGLASLDEREQQRFTERIHAGNIYINRTITGAIVQRQPFGGYQKSGFGPGAKAGGPNYVAQLCRAQPSATSSAPAAHAPPLPPRTAKRLERACALLPSPEAQTLRAQIADYARAYAAHFAKLHEPEQVLGQDNLFGYRPRAGVVLRLESDASLFDALASLLTAELCGAQLETSLAPDFPKRAELERLFPRLRSETTAVFAERAVELSLLRLLGTRTPLHDALSCRSGAHIADEAVLPYGALELLHYLREQSISLDYHRYGNLGGRDLREPT